MHRSTRFRRERSCMSKEDLAGSILTFAASLLNEPATDTNEHSVPSLTTPFSNTTQADWAEAVRLWNAHGRRLLSGVASRACPACAGQEHRNLFESYDGYPFVECIFCGCWYVPLVVDAALFERFFSDCPEAKSVLERSIAKRRSPENVAADMKRIGAYLDMLLPLLPINNGRMYLDVGCGLGHSLKAASERGMQAVGLESSRTCISIGTANGSDIRHIDDSLSGRFDLITFWESLEHMADPAAALSAALALLADKGLLAFTFPNQNSPLVRAQRNDCSVVNGGCDTPGHINLFNPSSIGVLLDRCGFSLLALDGQYGLNLPELVSYLSGNTRGAFDMLRGMPVDSGMSSLATSITKAIGPAVTVLERVTFTTPILFGFACRTESVGRFTRAVDRFNSRRKRQLLAEISNMTPQVLAVQQL
jgi:SAM-dependent methyltransferase